MFFNSRRRIIDSRFWPESKIKIQILSSLLWVCSYLTVMQLGQAVLLVTMKL